MRCASIGNPVVGTGSSARNAMKIGELAAQAGCDVQTVRFYEREGLLEEPAREASGYRRYAERHLSGCSSSATAARSTSRCRKCANCWSLRRTGTILRAGRRAARRAHRAGAAALQVAAGAGEATARPARSCDGDPSHPCAILESFMTAAERARLRLPRGAAPSHCSVTARAACRRPRSEGRVVRGVAGPLWAVHTRFASLSGSDR